MNHRLLNRLHVTVVALASASAFAAPPATRAEVTAQRAAIEQQFGAELAACEARFAVAACLDDVRQRRHDALAPLVWREQELVAQERRQRAAAQTQRVREREQAAAQSNGPRREPVAEVAVPPAPASHAARTRNTEKAVQARQLAAQQAEAEAAQRRAQAAERAQRQQQRMATHEAKEKGRTRPAAAPLPMPGALPASAASKPN